MQEICQHFAQWQPDKRHITIESLDCHTGGEPLRIITSGFPELIGKTILEKQKYCRNHFDNLRTSLMFEPRGHADMYGAIIVEAERSDSDFGAVFIHNEGYSSMCGHAVIALTKFAVESGVITKTGLETKVVIDVPCGQIKATAYGKHTEIDSVTFDCVPSYVLYQSQNIDIEDVGNITFDIAFGGAFYVYLRASEVKLECKKEHYNRLIEIGRKIKQAVSESYVIEHPYEQDLGFLYGTIFIDDSENPEIHSRNVCVFADGEVDRSPTGSGVCGRMAIHFAKNQVALNQVIKIESILGSHFQVEAIEKLTFATFPAIIPRVTGNAFICGKNKWFIDPNDPLRDGFLFR